MRKTLLTLVSFSIIFLLNADLVRAATASAGSSAELEMMQGVPVQDYRVSTLRKFLEEKNSPLADYSQNFVTYADVYNVDWRLVPAISGVESNFGKQMPKNSYNAWGWNNGNYKFKSWDNAIHEVTRTLRENYFDKGANSVDKIARWYCPPSNTWSWKVKYFENRIDPTTLNFDLASNF